MTSIGNPTSSEASRTFWPRFPSARGNSSAVTVTTNPCGNSATPVPDRLPDPKRPRESARPRSRLPYRSYRSRSRLPYRSRSRSGRSSRPPSGRRRRSTGLEEGLEAEGRTAISPGFAGRAARISAGRRAFRANRSGDPLQSTTSTCSPRSSRLTARMRAPPGPRQAATGFTPETPDQTAAFARSPGRRAAARTSTVPCRTSGVSRSMTPASNSGRMRERITGGSSASTATTEARTVSSGLNTSWRLCSREGIRPSTGPRSTIRSAPSRRVTVAVSSFPIRLR